MSPARATLLASGLLAALALAACTSGSRAGEKADALHDRGDYDGAVVRYAVALAERPGDEALARKLTSAREMAWVVHRERAADALERGDWPAATAELERVLELSPEDVEAERRLAEIREETARVRDAVEQAKKRLEADDPEGARRALAPHRDRLGAHPEGLDVLREADRRLLESALAEADAAIEQEDFAAARTAAARAAAVPPTSPAAEAALARAEAGLEAQGFAREAEAARGRGDYLGAIEGFRRSLARWPGLEAARTGLSRARADGATANLEAGARKLGAGRLPEALERYEAARLLAPEEATLEFRLDLAKALLARAEKHLDGGRPALAALHAERAADLAPADADIAPRVDAIRSRAGTALDEALRATVRISPLRNGTSEPLDVLGMGRSATARMLADGVLRWVAVAEDGADDVDATIEAEVTTFVVRRSPPVRGTRTVRYVDRMERVENPAHVEATDALRDAEADEREAALRLGDERRRLDLLARNRWDSWGRGRGRSGSPERDRLSYESAVLIQRSRLRRVERVWNEEVDRVGRIRDALSRIPSTIERPVFATHRLAETTQTVSGRAVAKLARRPATAGGPPAETEAYAGFSRDDTQSPGFAPADLPPDPDDLPDAEAAKAELVEGLVAALAKRMREIAESLASRHLAGADALPEPERSERRARFLLCGVAGPEKIREDLRASLRAATGLDVPALPASIQEGGE